MLPVPIVEPLRKFEIRDFIWLGTIRVTDYCLGKPACCRSLL
jgi:hypothetical protein